MLPKDSPIAPAPLDPQTCRRAFPDGSAIGRWAAADGWSLRTLRFPLPREARGSILFMGGRGDHFEKYLESFAQWTNAGWCVESFDWRGQGGSGRMGSDPVVGHADDFRVWVGDLDQYFTAWRARTPGPHFLIGHSMGGHLLLRALADGAIVPDGAVLSAPMLGFTAPYPDRLGFWIAQMMVRLTQPDHRAWKLSEKPGSPPAARQGLLTHDAARYADEQFWRTAHPDLAIGPASWQWVAAAYASFLHLAASGGVDRIACPVLGLVAGHDLLVSARRARALLARLPHGQIHVYGREAAHELLREADGVRDDVMARISTFMEGVSGA